MRVLVLDRNMQPVEIVGWRDAMELWMSGRAEVVKEYDDVWIKGVTQNWRLPSILRKRGRHKKKWGTYFSRHNVFHRDNHRCQYCGTQQTTNELTWDHVVPQCRGGKTVWENLVTACWDCNQKKRDRTPDEAGMRLIRKPMKPDLSPMFVLKMKDTDPVDWRDFLYWNAELMPG